MDKLFYKDMSEMHDEHNHAHEEHVSHRADSSPRGGSGNAVIKQMSRGLGVSLGALLLVTLVVLTVGLYKWQWSNPIIDAVVHVLPYPAATVNGSVISYADYVDDLETVNRFFAKQIAQGQVEAAPSDDELKKGVLDRLIQMEILKQEGKHYSLEVSAEDIEAEFSKISASGDGKAEEQIKELYGWTTTQFKEKVLRPYLMQAKLGEAISADDTISAGPRAKADEALAKLSSGSKFEEVAKEYSADPGSAALGGDLGWFGKGMMVPEFEAAAFALEPGATSGLVRSQFGWHIIRTMEVKKGDDGAVEEVKASHILIAGPNVADYLKEKLDNAKISRYVKI